MQEVFEKIIDKLEERTSFFSDCTKYGNKDAKQQKKSYSTMMMYEVADLVDDLMDIVKQEAEQYNNGWIPCSEKLPKSNGVYQVTHKVRECEYTYYLTSASYFDGQDTWHNDVCVNHARRYLDVVAWIPLPEEYKEGDRE